MHVIWEAVKSIFVIGIAAGVLLVLTTLFLFRKGKK